MKNYILGLIIIFIGVIIGLNSFDIVNINLFFNGWWTLFIIIPSFVGLFNSTSKTGSIIGLTKGILLLLSCQNILSFSIIWKLMLPVILVVIGLSFIFKDNKVEKINISDKNNKEICATFGEEIIKVKDLFEGADLTAVFGSVKYDLSDSDIKKDIIINASSIFGGIDITLKEGVNVKVKSTPIFGGVNNKYKGNGKYTIYINCTCLFGGVNIK